MRAALFDLDETILDRSLSLRYFAAWQSAQLLGSKGINTIRFIDRFIELDANGSVWKDVVYASLIEEFDLNGYSADQLLETYLNKFCEFCKPRDGAFTVIKAFRSQGYKLGLVSNGQSPFQEKNFAALGFSDLFDCVIVSEAVNLRKPDPRIFELACKKLGADIHDSVFIGDNPVADIKGAKQAGMSTIYVPVSSHYPPCEFADVTLTDLDNIAEHIDSESMA